eukprot:3345247-Amphidinium_carterae.1
MQWLFTSGLSAETWGSVGFRFTGCGLVGLKPSAEHTSAHVSYEGILTQLWNTSNGASSALRYHGIKTSPSRSQPAECMETV